MFIPASHSQSSGREKKKRTLGRNNGKKNEGSGEKERGVVKWSSALELILLLCEAGG